MLKPFPKNKLKKFYQGLPTKRIAAGAWLGSYLVVRQESYHRFWWFKWKK